VLTIPSDSLTVVLSKVYHLRGETLSCSGHYMFSDWQLYG
jgi:hypothetical protein